MLNALMQNPDVQVPSRGKSRFSGPEQFSQNFCWRAVDFARQKTGQNLGKSQNFDFFIHHKPAKISQNLDFFITQQAAKSGSQAAHFEEETKKKKKKKKKGKKRRKKGRKKKGRKKRRFFFENTDEMTFKSDA